MEAERVTHTTRYPTRVLQALSTGNRRRDRTLVQLTAKKAKSSANFAADYDWSHRAVAIGANFTNVTDHYRCRDRLEAGCVGDLTGCV